MRTIAKPGTDSSYHIIEDGEVVGYIDRTTDKTGHKCWGVFFEFKKPMLTSSFVCATAIAESYQENDFN
jgi:hypothetical protein